MFFKKKTKNPFALFLILFLSISLTLSGILFLKVHNVFAATRTWDGGGTDGTCGGNAGDGNKWSCAANWSSDIVPVAGDTVVFGATSTKNATIDAGFSGTVTNLQILSNYSGTITQARSLTVSSGFLQQAGTFNSGSHALNITKTTLHAFDLSGGTFTAPSTSLTVNGGISISASATFNHNGGTLYLTNTSGGGSLGLACGNKTFNSVVFNNTTKLFIGSDCTLPIGNNPTIGADSINSLYGTLSGTGTITFASGSSINFYSNNNFSGFTGIVSNGALYLDGGTWNLGSYTTADFNGQLGLFSGTFTAPSGNMTVSAGFTIREALTFNHNSGTITLDGNDVLMGCRDATFNRIVLSHTGYFRADGGVGSATPCTLALGNNPTITGSVNTDLPLSGTGTLTTQSDFAPHWQVFTGGISGFTGLNAQANFSASGVSISDLQTVVVSGDFYISALDNTPEWVSLTVGGTTTIQSSLTLTNATTADFNHFIQNSSTFNAPSGTMTVSGNFTRSGATFNPNSGTINFDGTNQTITGATTFYNLTKNVTAADTLTFAAGSETIVNNTLTLTGTSGNLLSLRSSSPGTQWEINPKGTRTISYLDVQDSINANFFHINVIGFNITDSGNNVNWNFAGNPDPEELEFYTVDPFDDEITLYNGNTAQVLSSATLTYPGKTITGAQGLAFHPLTCSLYGLLTFSGQNGRQLVTINPDTGVATNVGNTGKKFAGITFDGNGTLYGVTGDGESNLPETLYTINTSTGAPTQFMSLGNGDNGEAISYNTDDGYLYHLSGNVFEKINLSTLAITDIPLNLSEFDGETTGMMYVADRDYFYIAHYTNVATLSLTGTEDDLESFTTDIKGMARNNCVPQVAPTASSLGPTSLVNGSSDSDTTPTFNFTTNDANSADTVKYHIQIDDSADFLSPVVDYTSALAAQGSSSFTVGQVAGSGTYATGTAGQTLSDGSYYWRVQATDNFNNTGSYATANSGSIAFVISSVTANAAPDMPSSLGPSDLTSGGVINNNHPSVSFVLSDSNGGDTVQYHIQIDDSSDFSSPVIDYTSGLTAQGLQTFMVGQDAGTGSYAVGSSGQGLTNGSYYWRVQAIDVNDTDSAFAHARPGEVAFIVNYAAPPAASPSPSSSGVCTATAPLTAPTLYSATPNGPSSIELSFSRVSGEYDHYDLQYGTSPNVYQYGSTNIGDADTRKYTVSALDPTARYYFQVRAVNGCTPGNWSEEVSARIAGSGTGTADSTGSTTNLINSNTSTTSAAFMSGGTGGSTSLTTDHEQTPSDSATEENEENTTFDQTAGFTAPTTALGELLAGVQRSQILGSFTEALVHFRDTAIASIATAIPFTRVILNSDLSQGLAAVLPTLTLLVPVTAAVTTSLAGNSLLSPIVSIVTKVLQFLGLVPKRKPQGIVFDTKTGAAIPFVSITITRKGETAIIDQVVTDEFGVYQSVQLAEGQYSIAANHQDYTFPTVKPRSPLTSVFDFFKGEEIKVSRQNQEQFVLIPMDPKSDSFVAAAQKKTPSVFLQIVSRYLQVLFVPLAIMSLVVTFFFPTLLNLLIAALYAVLFIANRISLLKRPQFSGKIRDDQSRLLKGVVVRCIETATNRLVATRLSDKKGAFAFRIKPGTYTLIITKEGYSLADGGQLGDNIHVTHDSQSKPLDIKMSPRSTTIDDTFFDQIAPATSKPLLITSS